MRVAAGMRYLAECFLAMASVLRAVANLQDEQDKRVQTLEQRVSAIEAHLRTRR